MDSLLSQFDESYNAAERLLLRHEHHGFFPANEHEHRQQRLEASVPASSTKPKVLTPIHRLRSSLYSPPKRKTGWQMIPGLKPKSAKPTRDQLAQANKNLEKLLMELRVSVLF